MRKPNLDNAVSINDREYTCRAMLAEFVWGNPYWSTDEATVASFDRLTANMLEQEDADFDRVCAVLRQVQFPAYCSIECAHLRNTFVLTKKETAPPPIALPPLPKEIAAPAEAAS